MPGFRTREPNPAANRPLTPRFFTDLVDYAEYQSTWGRPWGLLPPRVHEKPVLPDFEPPEVLQLPWLRAIGERGYPIVVEPDDPDARIRPLDTSKIQLPPGPNIVYACLRWERVPCGDLEEYESTNGGAPERVRRERASQVVLAIGEKRLDFRDWLPVARIEQIRVGGAVRTVVDRGFHPPVVDMRAWALANPLLQLVERAFQALGDDTFEGPSAALRVELDVLRNLAESAPPAVVFAQAQRCLGHLRVAALPGLNLDGALESFRYGPEGFCSFLIALGENLKRDDVGERYPSTLVIDGERYMLLPGELQAQDNVWSWTPPRENFHVNDLAVYFPGLRLEEIPSVRYGRRANDLAGFRPGAPAREVSAGGCAVKLPGIPSPVERVFVTGAANVADFLLERRLRNGHALYRS